MRTITAPTSASKEALDLSDVNLVNDSTSYYNNSYARKKYSLADNVGGSGVSCGGLFNDSIMSAQSNQSKKGRHPPPLLHRMSSTDQVCISIRLGLEYSSSCSAHDCFVKHFFAVFRCFYFR